MGREGDIRHRVYELKENVSKEWTERGKCETRKEGRKVGGRHNICRKSKGK